MLCRRWLVAVGFLTVLADVLALAGEPVHFSPEGVQLPGSQFLYDAGFEVLDWNGGGAPDIFLPNTSLMAFSVHLNEGTGEQPRFGHAVGYPVNLTETEPQTLEHNSALAIGDLNGDGLFNLVCFDGQLRWVPNTGTKHGPNHWQLAKLPPHFFPGSEEMIRENARFSTGPESMFWNKGIFARQVLTLTIADWDGDGLNDLLISRFKDEAPGVLPTGGSEQWTAWGRQIVSRPTNPLPPADAPKFLEKLDKAPERGLYFYRNVGTREKPWFDKGLEITLADGQSLAAPNPVVADLDADGLPDLLSCETDYSCNAFRVDWPTHPHVIWHRRAGQEPGVLEPAQPLTDAAGAPIAAGTQARLADFRGQGVLDLLVMDAGWKGTIRWYRNQAPAGATPRFAPAELLRGTDFLRFDFMAQPLIVDWFSPGSRDLIIHGNTDAHCKWSLRRTALYRNVAQQPGELKYEFAGLLRYLDDPRMVEPQLEDRPYDIYGSAVSLMPDDGTGQKRLMMSVSGKLYLFSNLAADGLTFQSRVPLDLPAERNRDRGWQEIAIQAPEKVRHIRIGNDRNGMGNLRDSFLHLVRFEALAGEQNLTTWDNIAAFDTETKETVPWYHPQRPQLMFDPKTQPAGSAPQFTSFGYYMGPATITLKQPAALDKIRFQLSDREERWYNFYLPFYWQGQLYRNGTEQGEPWYQYKVEVSADGTKWTTVADTMPAEMIRSFPVLVDWDGDGHCDLLLGVLNGNGIWPATKEVRLYRNRGTNAEPQFPTFEPILDEKGQPLHLQAYWYSAYALQCGVAVRDLDGDGLKDLVVEGFNEGDLVVYRNVSTEAGGLRFQADKQLGHPQPIRYGGGYRYFDLTDVDGDGVADLINSVGAQTIWFKGTPQSAPARVADLEVTAGSDRVELHWTRPAKAARYELRWSREPITELAWPTLAAQVGEYTAPEGQPQSAALSALPAGAVIYVAVKSLNEQRQAGALSNNVEAAVAPLRRIVLQNGPDYQGAEACFVDAQSPGTVTPRIPCCLSVRALVPRGEKQKVVLLRFKKLPDIGAVERAVLELTTESLGGASQQKPAMLAISCNVIRDDWIVDQATFAEAAPGRPWQPGELDAGGEFVSMAEPSFTVTPDRIIRWDVTEAVRAARKAGRDSLSLLVRVDYTGNYIAGQGYAFCGADHPEAARRPRLKLTGRAKD